MNNSLAMYHFHCFLNLKVASRSPKALEDDFQKDAVPIITSATHLVVQKTMKYFHATESSRNSNEA